MNQAELVVVLVREVERQLPGVVVPMQAMHSFVTAAHFIVEELERKPIKGSFTPVASDDDGIAPMALDRVPGWEAA
jgi:hypothetical protein